MSRQLARGRGTHVHVRACVVFGLVIAASGEGAMVAADGLIDAAEATRNLYLLSFALLAYGFAFGHTDPVRSVEPSATVWRSPKTPATA